jgi:hypothetical protein
LSIFVAGSVCADVVINDPLAYWSFDETSTLLSNGVTSGSYLDASVLVGQPEVGVVDGASGIVGNAMVLDGTSAIRLPFHQDNLGTSFTVSLWYWQQTNDTRQCVYQSRDNWVASYEAVESARDTFAIHVGQVWAGTITTGLKSWVHLMHTFSTVAGITTLSVYSNGVLRLTKGVSTNDMFVVNQVRGLHVGAYRSATESGEKRGFKGMIDELALWNRALSADEALAVYQRGAGGQKLEFKAEASPELSLGGSQREFELDVSDGVPDGMFYNGWLLNDVQDPFYPSRLADTAGDTNSLPDTAGHVDGPFDAESFGDQWKIPQAVALREISLGDFTAEAWFRTTSTSMNVLLGNYSPSYKGIINLQLEVDNRVRLYLKNAGGTVDSVYPTTAYNEARDGQWHHLAGIRSNNVMYLYLDGLEVGSQVASGGTYSLGGDYYYLGRDTRTGPGPFNGEIGDARLWTRALSTNELASLVDFGKPGFNGISRSNLLAEYALYEPFDARPASPKCRIPLDEPQLRQISLTNVTYEAVFRTTDTGRGVIIGNYTLGLSGGVNNIELYTGNQVRFVQRDASGVWLEFKRSADTVTLSDGEWHRCAAVRRDGYAYLYLDGQQLGTAVSDTLGAYMLPGASLGLGRDFREPVMPLNGDLSHVRIWNRALSANELAGLAASNAVPAEGLIAEYAPLYTNTLKTAGFPGDRFLRSYTTGTNTATLVFTDLPRHNKISIGMLLAQLDSLDPSLQADHFVIRIDGGEVLSVGLGPDQGDEPQVDVFKLFGAAADVQDFKDTLTLGGDDFFFCGTDDADWNDHVYDLSQLEAFQEIPHTGSTLTLELFGVQNSAGENEGFGVDQIQLNVIAPSGTLILVK